MCHLYSEDVPNSITTEPLSVMFICIRVKMYGKFFSFFYGELVDFVIAKDIN